MNKDLPCTICGQPVQHIGLCKKHYYIKNKDKLNKTKRECRAKDKEKLKKYYNTYKTLPKNVLHYKEYQKKYYQNNRNKLILGMKNYRNINREKFKQKNKIQYIKNINYKLTILLRGRLTKALKRNIKSTNTLKLLGCEIEELKVYLEQKFRPGMNWNNNTKYGWHIDHIIPCCKFDLTKEEQQQKCFHYTNLQPLWSNENLSKGNKIINEVLKNE